MELKYNVSGGERKRLVTAMSAILECGAKYLGAPTFAYEIGHFTVDKEGAARYGDDVDCGELEYLVERLKTMGFAAETAPDETTESDAPDEPVESETPDADESDTDTDLENTIDSLVITYPRKDMTDAALENLRRLVASKESLIKKALGVDALPIEVTDETVSFPWFKGFPKPEEISAYAHFTGKLIGMAKMQKRVSGVEKPADNQKYAFRCFLLRLGFIGAEYQAARKILLRNLSGSGAFRDGQKKGFSQADLDRAKADPETRAEINAILNGEDGGDDE